MLATRFDGRIMSGTMRTRPFPVVNVLQVRGLGARRRPFLAQADQNRLLGIPVDILLARGQLAVVTDDAGLVIPGRLTASEEASDILDDILSEYEEFRQEDLRKWGSETLDQMAAVANGPSRTEISDLGVVDTFFGESILEDRQPKRDWPFLRRLCGADPDRRMDRLLLLRDESHQGLNIAALQANPFFCTPPSEMPRSWMFRYVSHGEAGFGKYFRIGVGEWGDVRRQVRNTISLLTALADYPFPSPISAAPGVWFWVLRDELVKFVKSDYDIHPELARLWVTLLTVENYNRVSSWVVAVLKDRAKRQKRKAIINKIALGAALIVIGVGVGIALSTAIPVGSAVSSGQVGQAATKIIGQEMAYQERRQAAEDMEQVARQFEQDDAAFAAEARRAADTIDAMAAAETRSRGLAPEEEEAIREGLVEREINPRDVGVHDFYPLEHESAPITDLLLGGGIAAVGIGLLALLR
jgi:hypothetical protein